MRRLALRTKLIVSFLAVGVIPFAIVAVVSLWKAGGALEGGAYDKLVAVRDIKASQVRGFFRERKTDMQSLVETVGALRGEAVDKLTGVRQVKGQAVSRYFQTIENQMITFSQNEMVVRSMREFSRTFGGFREENQVSGEQLADMRSRLASYYTDEFAAEYRKINDGADPQATRRLEQLDDDSIAFQYHYIRANRHPLGSKHLLDHPGDTSAYSTLHQRVHPIVRTYLEKFGYYDIFLVDIDSGDIVYSVFKELDYSTSLLDGPYARTNFGEVFRKARAATSANEVFLVDYKRYWPSYEAPASFIASPIFDGEEKIGVAIFQMPIDRINAIMADRAGLGETGETYLVGPDKLLRCDTFRDPENRSVGASFRRPETGKVDTPAVANALRGQAGADVIHGYHGQVVLSAYCPIDVGGMTWALLAEVDIAEAFCPHVEGHEEDYFTRYQREGGYYDLFLINPDGFCFYTVCHEADYRTNLLTGPYSQSNLGRLTREVIETKQFGIADFEPYAPSADEPAAFMAMPVLHDGKVEVVVALQLSLEAINEIMTQRAGMGQTGETYLVGSDHRMRSDSFLDPEGHSVKASFAGTVEDNGVRTRAAEQALAGQTGAEVIVDYNGNPVLSAYAPVDVDGVRWALLAEVDASEAFSATRAMTWIIGIVAGAGIAAILTVAWWVAASIATPVNRIAENLSWGASQTANAAEQVSTASQSLASGTSENAAAIEETTASVEQMSSMTKSTAANADEAKGLSAGAREAADRGSEAMERMNQAIDDIKASSDETAKIIKTIDDIAFQTNLLALNAAVEAARAGEAGKGFAVVAEEVRNLAQRSAEAARTTSDMIERSVKNAESGVNISKEVGSALDEIAGGARKVNDLVAEIASACADQSRGIDQITDAVGRMDSVTQGNAANAQQTAAAAEELGSQSGELNGMVQQLEGLIKGSSASGTPSAADATVRPETHPRGNGPRRSRPAGRARTARPDQADDHASGCGDRAPSGRGAEPAEKGATEAASCEAEALSEF